MYLNPSKLVYLRLLSCLCSFFCPPISVLISLSIDFSEIENRKKKSYYEIDRYIVTVLVVITIILTVVFFFPGSLLAMIIYYFSFEGPSLFGLMKQYGPLKPSSNIHSNKYQDLYKEEDDNVTLLIQKKSNVDKRPFFKRIMFKYFLPYKTSRLGQKELINFICSLLYMISYMYIGSVVMLGSPIMQILESELNPSIKKKIGTHFISQGLGCIIGTLLCTATLKSFRNSAALFFLELPKNSQLKSKESYDDNVYDYENEKITDKKLEIKSISNPHYQFVFIHVLLTSLIFLLQISIHFYWLLVGIYFIIGIGIGMFFNWSNIIMFSLWKDKAQSWIYLNHIFLSIGFTFPVLLFYAGDSFYPFAFRKISFLFHIALCVLGIFIATAYLFSDLPIITTTKLKKKEPTPLSLEKLFSYLRWKKFKNLFIQQRGWSYLLLSVILLIHFGMISSLGNLSSWHAKDFSKYHTLSSFFLGLDFWFSYFVGSIFSFFVYLISHSLHLILVKCFIGMVIYNIILLIWPSSYYCLLSGISGIGFASASLFPTVLCFLQSPQPNLFFGFLLISSVFMGFILITPISSLLMHIFGHYGLFLSSSIFIVLNAILLFILNLLNLCFS